MKQSPPATGPQPNIADVLAQDVTRFARTLLGANGQLPHDPASAGVLQRLALVFHECGAVAGHGEGQALPLASLFTHGGRVQIECSDELGRAQPELVRQLSNFIEHGTSSGQQGSLFQPRASYTVNQVSTHVLTPKSGRRDSLESEPVSPISPVRRMLGMRAASAPQAEPSTPSLPDRVASQRSIRASSTRSSSAGSVESTSSSSPTARRLTPPEGGRVLRQETHFQEQGGKRAGAKNMAANMCSSTHATHEDLPIAAWTPQHQAPTADGTHSSLFRYYSTQQGALLFGIENAQTGKTGVNADAGVTHDARAHTNEHSAFGQPKFKALSELQGADDYRLPHKTVATLVVNEAMLQQLFRSHQERTAGVRHRPCITREELAAPVQHPYEREAGRLRVQEVERLQAERARQLAELVVGDEAGLPETPSSQSAPRPGKVRGDLLSSGKVHERSIVLEDGGSRAPHSWQQRASVQGLQLLTLPPSDSDLKIL